MPIDAPIVTEGKVSRAWELHPDALPELDVNLSAHPAPLSNRYLDSDLPVGPKLRRPDGDPSEPMGGPALMIAEFLVFPAGPAH